jgi:hypothetical protein
MLWTNAPSNLTGLLTPFIFYAFSHLEAGRPGAPHPVVHRLCHQGVACERISRLNG